MLACACAGALQSVPGNGTSANLFLTIVTWSSIIRVVYLRGSSLPGTRYHLQHQQEHGKMVENARK
jgi:hypothetical protein